MPHPQAALKGANATQVWKEKMLKLFFSNFREILLSAVISLLH